MLITVGQHEAIICRFDADGSRCNFAEVKYVEKAKTGNPVCYLTQI